MFNIPLKKERGIQAGDFVVPTAEFKTWMEAKFDHIAPSQYMMYVIDGDVMRDGKYISLIPIVMTDQKWQREAQQDTYIKKSYIYSKDVFVREDTPEKAYHNLGFELGNTLARVLYGINNQYSKQFHERGMAEIDVDAIREKEIIITGDDY
tara:strand:+ start:3312 stop:3764 length:453 start_codon:yes stop_codon:yes gene_type:complete